MNLDVTNAVSGRGCYYAPDPSSQVICSIGGNVAENSGGVHCLKYGFTVHHVVGLEAVLPDGEMIHVGGAALDAPGLDLLGVLVGSEGTLAVVTKITLRLLRKPAAVKTLLAAFDSTKAAGDAVSGIIGAGIIPAAVEMMDRTTIEAAEAAVHPNFPPAEAVLIVELDGANAEVTALFEQVEGVCRGAGAREIRVAQTDEQRAMFWKGREGGVCGDGSRVAQLLRSGRRDSADEITGSARPYPSPGGRVRSQDWQRVFMPATATSIRSCAMTTVSRDRQRWRSRSRRRS